MGLHKYVSVYSLISSTGENSVVDPDPQTSEIFLHDPDPELEVMDPDPKLDLKKS
jgi:hypothetical protein